MQENTFFSLCGTVSKDDFVGSKSRTAYKLCRKMKYQIIYGVADPQYDTKEKKIGRSKRVSRFRQVSEGF